MASMSFVYMSILLSIFGVTMDVAWFSWWTMMIPTTIGFPFLGWTFMRALLGSGVIDSIPTTDKADDEGMPRSQRVAVLLVGTVVVVAVLATIGLPAMQAIPIFGWGIPRTTILAISVALFFGLLAVLWMTKRRK
jgi:hypothetical protein